MKHNGLELRKGKGNTGDIVVDTLINHGIDNMYEYKHIDMSNVPLLNPSTLNNIDLAFSRLQEAIDKNQSIGILVDGDADGFASASLLYQGLSKLTEKVTIFTNDVKSHGLAPVMEEVILSDFNLLFTPDASSNDIEYHKILSEEGVDVIALDHHIINDESDVKETPAIIVNNQNNNNKDTNTNYVGVGMVYLFLRYINEQTHAFKDMDEFLPLFALGQITDMSDISDPEIKAQVDKGLSLMVKHPLFRYFTKDVVPSAHKVSFEIAPKINAVARIGSGEERLNLLLAMAEDKNEYDTEVFNKRKKNPKTGLMESKPVTLNPYQIETDEMLRIKRKQDNLVKKVVEDLDYLSEKKNGLIIAKLDNDTPSAVTGLLANRIISKTQTPAMVIKESDKNKEAFIGSMRCPKNFEFRTWLNDTGVVKSSGHEQAAGVEGLFGDLNDLLSKSKDLDISQSYYDVDAIFNEYSASEKPIKEVNESVALFGGKVKEPLIGYTAIPINKNHINVKNSVIKFSYNKINFIMFNSADFVNWLMDSGFKNEFHFDIVGSVGESTWSGRTETHVVIKDIALSNQDKVRIETPEDLVF